jgi:hypothetical protein
MPVSEYDENIRASDVLVTGHGIHWPEVDEDISTILLIEGLPSIEYTRARTG